MFRISICFILYLSVFALSAQVQVDTVYITYSDGEKKTTRDSATHFRIQKTFSDTLYAEEYRLKDSILRYTCYCKSFDPYEKEGLYIMYSDSGYVTAKGMYAANKQTGEWNTYFSNGHIWYTLHYVDDKRNGSLISYYNTGEVKRRCEYMNDSLITGKCFRKNGADTAYYDFYIYPKFRGGDAALVRYFQKNLKYPKEAMKYKLEGKVYVQFTVKKDGTVADVKLDPKRNSYYMLNDAAIDFVKQMPKWSPGYVDGELKDFKKGIPILFKLEK